MVFKFIWMLLFYFENMTLLLENLWWFMYTINKHSIYPVNLHFTFLTFYIVWKMGTNKFVVLFTPSTIQIQKMYIVHRFTQKLIQFNFLVNITAGCKMYDLYNFIEAIMIWFDLTSRWIILTTVSSNFF